MALTDFLSNGQIPAGSAAMSKTSQTILPDWYTNYAMQVLANQNAASTMPYTPYAGPRVAEFSPTQQASFDLTGQAANAYQPALGQATQATQNAMQQPGALNVAQPYLGGAAQTAPGVVQQYMNPYQDAVVNRIADLGVRNLNEKIMPGIEGRYIASGQLGFGGRQPGAGTPSGMMTDTARAVRDVSDDILGQQSAALQAGYTGALGAAQTDLSRMGQLAQTAGNLGYQQNAQQLAGAEQLAGLGAQAQQLGLTGAGALGQVGALQQGQAQKNIDTAYADFLRQQGYPQEQINNMLTTFNGIKAGVPTATTEEGIVPTNYAPQYKPGTAETIAGAISGIGGILSSLGVF